MRALQKKLNKTGGFTLIEMLLVVAIIAILAAVSVPMVNSSLEAARDAADQANERSAKAAALMVYMGVGEIERGGSISSGGGGQGNFPLNPGRPDGDLTGGTADITNPDSSIYYDAARGILTIFTGNIAPYGKCTEDCVYGEAAAKFDSTTEPYSKPSGLPDFGDMGLGLRALNEENEETENSHVGKMIRVYVQDGEVVLTWSTPVLHLLG